MKTCDQCQEAKPDECFKQYSYNNSRRNKCKECRTIYQKWRDMKRRCLDPNNHRYEDWGGRGITVHQEWVDDFDSYFDYVTSLPGCDDPDKPTLDRIDNNGNYEPGNLRWAGHSTQANNRRRHPFRKKVRATHEDGRVVEVDGMRKFCREFDLDYRSVLRVIDGEYSHTKGWTIEVVEEPSRS